MTYDFAAFSYAGLLALGGVIGYAKASSLPSLVAGLAFSTLITIGAFLVSSNRKNVWLLVLVSFTLSIFMGKRFLASGKFMPAGLVTLVSLGMLVRYGSRLL